MSVLPAGCKVGVAREDPFFSGSTEMYEGFTEVFELSCLGEKDGDGGMYLSFVLVTVSLGVCVWITYTV